MSAPTTSPHQVLGVPTDATDEQIQAAYRRRIRETHPDMGGDSAEASRVNQAWAQLKDPNYRPPEPQEHGPDGSTARPRPATGPPRHDSGPSEPGTPHSRPKPRQDTAHVDNLRAAATKPVRAWWATPYAWLPAGVWLIALAISVITGGINNQMVWVAAGLYTAGTWLPVARKGLKASAVALIAAVAIEVVYITPDTPMVILLAAIILVWTGVAVARRVHRANIYRSLRAQYALACTYPRVDSWLVVSVEYGSASTRCLLENDNTGSQVTRMLWGSFEVGDRVALLAGDTSDLPDMVLPHEAQEKRRRR